jgi:hypothetical protein
MAASMRGISVSDWAGNLDVTPDLRSDPGHHSASARLLRLGRLRPKVGFGLSIMIPPSALIFSSRKKHYR